MFEFIRELLSLHNLPCTVLLGLVMFYWLLVVLGIVDSEIEGGGSDMPDHHGGGHDSPAPLNVQSNHNAAATTGGGGVSSAKKRFFSFGEVPLNIAGSILAIFLWVGSMLGNYYFNGVAGNRSGITATLLLFPNLMVSFILTRIVIIPLDRFFTALQQTATENEVIIGRQARVVSARVDERYGQVEITTNGAPVLVNARIMTGHTPVTKGTQVTITSNTPDSSFYFVEPLSSGGSSPSTP